MSQRAQKWSLWLAFFALVPVPFVLAATGFAPPLRVLFLASMLGAIALVDGAQGPMPIFLGLLFGQVALFAALAYLAAHLLLRAFARLVSERWVSALVGLTIALLLCVSFFDIYYTPHSSSLPYANVTGLFD
jgi:hypothetical protein